MWRRLAVVVIAFRATAALAAEPGADGPPAFFDPVVAITPGISREAGLLGDHTRDPEGRLTQTSLRLQHPVLSWLQLSLEMPVVVDDPDTGSTVTGAGDLLLVGQAMVWTSRSWPAEVDLGLELTLPTGSSSVQAGSTALRPFVAAGVKLGPLDVIANLSYQWGLGGPASETEQLQAVVAVGYPVRRVAPFAELILVEPVRGAEDRRPQVSVVPGIELFLPWRLSLSLGVQLPLGSARAFDQLVLGFLKWPF